MIRSIIFCSSLTLLLAFAAVSVATGQSKSRNKATKAPVELTGQQIYKSYCAACHGDDAKGHGPAAPALKVAPPDLTLLAQNNKGVFPESHFSAVVVNGFGEPAHGSTDMPVWGPFFAGVNDQRLVTLRIQNLTKYIESLQQK